MRNLFDWSERHLEVNAMKVLKSLLLFLLLMLGAGYVGAQLLLYERAPSNDQQVDILDPQLIQRGKYIARTADCIACHTTADSRPFAGGLAMDTPLGIIYSTNITPDRETGIGTYTFNQFDNAVRHGVSATGTPLYPAMPYPSYTIMPREDIKALYAYFISEVKPVSQPNEGSTFPWPLNLRWPIAWWQALFAPSRQFVAQDPTDARLVRGQYLTEGPGHCGACHTPRGLFYQEKALSLADGDSYLSGAVIDGWRAKSLRGEARGLQSWSMEELELFFKTGRNNIAAAFGAMADVVQHSTQYYSDDDIGALSAYLKRLPPVKDKLQSFSNKTDTTTAALLTRNNPGSLGAIVYMQYCVTCHRADGKGIARIFPALAGNSAIYARNPQSVIQIVLEGGRMPHTKYDRMAFAMPGFPQLSDDQILAVINFIRNGWTNQAPDIEYKDIQHMRQFLAGKAVNTNTPQEGKHE
ncbi:c-type cytochrome [Advenella incenata]